MIVEQVKVVELTFEDGTKKLCRGGEEAVYRAWNTYPVVSARWTGEEETMQWVYVDEIYQVDRAEETSYNRIEK